MTIKELLTTLNLLERRNDFINIIKHYPETNQINTFLSTGITIEHSLNDLNYFFEKEHEIFKIDIYYNTNQIDIHIK